MTLTGVLFILKKNYQRLRENCEGSLAAAFAIIFPLIIAGAGVAMDISQAYLVKKKLGQALDAAALATAASRGDYDELYDKLTLFVDRNYTSPDYASPHTVNMVLNDSKLYASAETTVDTSFMRMFGQDTIDVFVETEVQLEVRGVEVVLVLDNTGSMAGQNIRTLRDASESFVNILFNAASEDSSVKIGLVPYSTSVNVGTYGLGDNPDGTYYGDAFVNNPLNLDYDLSSSNEWHGCVLAEDNPLDVQDHAGPWDMYRYCRDSSENPTCDSYWWYGHKYPRRSPNYICPETSVVPLTSDRNKLLNSIDDMEADGWTLGNYGLVWGWRLISPEFPFQEGAEYDDQEWSKVVIMMTDGINTMHQHYTAYGRTSSHDIRPDDLNNRMEDVCDAMKLEDITIYTVTFESGVNENTKDYFRRCASTEDKYHDAPSQDDLVRVFEQISRELSNIHLSR